MIFSKQELSENYPLKERIQLEKSKTQNNPIFWINEIIRRTSPGASDVLSLLDLSQNLVEQVESMYAEKEDVMATSSAPTLPSAESIHTPSPSHSSEGSSVYLEEQIVELYREKEEILSRFPGIGSLHELVDMVHGMEEQLVNMYNDKEMNGV